MVTVIFVSGEFHAKTHFLTLSVQQVQAKVLSRSAGFVTVRTFALDATKSTRSGQVTFFLPFGEVND
jgi:hypothetical protein